MNTAAFAARGLAHGSAAPESVGEATPTSKTVAAGRSVTSNTVTTDARA